MRGGACARAAGDEQCACVGSPQAGSAEACLLHFLWQVHRPGLPLPTFFFVLESIVHTLDSHRRRSSATQDPLLLCRFQALSGYSYVTRTRSWSQSADLFGAKQFSGVWCYLVQTVCSVEVILLFRVGGESSVRCRFWQVERRLSHTDQSVLGRSYGSLFYENCNPISGHPLSAAHTMWPFVTQSVQNAYHRPGP